MPARVHCALVAGPIPNDPGARRARRARHSARRAAAEAQSHRHRVGREFYFIAGLTLVTSVSIYASASGGGFVFFAGLTSTFVVDMVGIGVAPATHGVSLFMAAVLDAVIAGIFVGAGILAGRGHGWAVGAGAIFYLLDGLLALGAALLSGQGIFWAMAGFHVFLIWVISVRWKKSKAMQNAAVVHAGRARRAAGDDVEFEDADEFEEDFEDDFEAEPDDDRPRRSRGRRR